MAGVAHITQGMLCPQEIRAQCPGYSNTEPECWHYLQTPKDIRHRQDRPTQGIRAIWGAFLAPPHLSAAARRGSSWIWFIPHHRLLSRAVPSPGRTRARGAVTSEHGRLCLATAASEQEPSTNTARGCSLTPKMSWGKARAHGGAGRAQKEMGKARRNWESPKRAEERLRHTEEAADKGAGGTV